MEISHAKGWLSKSVIILQILMQTLGEIEHIPRVIARVSTFPAMSKQCLWNSHKRGNIFTAVFFLK